MRLRALLLAALISLTDAQRQPAQRPSRAPQAQIKYHDPNGLKVDWKYFAPQNQWRAHLQNSQQQSQQAEAAEQTQVHPSQPQSPLLQVDADYHRSYSQPEIQPETQQISNQIQYGRYVQPQQYEEQDPSQLQYKVYPAPQAQVEGQPEQTQPNQDNRYTDATTHAKQILESYKSQGTYTEPRAALYQSDFVTAQQYDQQPRSQGYQQSSSGYEQQEQPKSRRDYADRRLQGRIVYKDDYEQQQQRNSYEQQQQQQRNSYEQQQQQETQVEHIPVPIERIPVPSPQKLVIDQSMPKEIQQLLHYQARLPYDVIANSIVYKPKTLFVPKQISDDAEVKEPYQYRSKIYYVNHGQYEDDFEVTKPVEENQRH